MNDIPINEALAQTPPVPNKKGDKKKPAIRHAEKRRTSTCRFADRVAQLSVNHYKEVIPLEQRPPQTCIATILAHYRDDNDDAREDSCLVGDGKNQGRLWILSMGVGTKFLPESSLRQEVENQNQEGYGSRVRDMHAEVLARRAFRRQLTLEIQEDLRQRDEDERHQSDDKTMPILVRCENSNTIQYKLRPGITLHMYTSSAPCGNATLKKFCKMSKEKFRDDLGPDEWPNGPHEPPLGHSLKLGEFSLLVKKNNPNMTKQSSKQDDETMSGGDSNALSDGNKRKNEEKPSSTASESNMDQDTDSTKSTKRTKNQEEGSSSDIPNPLQPPKPTKRRGKPWPSTLSDDWAPPGTTIVGFKHKGSLHTCSDKICRWNYLGLQGSLLAGLLEEPLYLSSLTVGRKLSGAVCRRAVCCRLDTRCRQPRFSDKDSFPDYNDEQTQKYRVNHPAVMGTSVYLSDGVVDTNNIEEGQDVRFHSSVVWTWWQGLPEGRDSDKMDTDNSENGTIECIDSSSGLLATSSEDSSDNHQAVTGPIPSAAPKVSTKELMSLFLQVYQNTLSERNSSIDSAGNNECGNTSRCNREDPNMSFDNTLSGIRDVKKRCSPMHENFKDLLLTEHKVLSQWRRREEAGKCSYCPVTT